MICHTSSDSSPNFSLHKSPPEHSNHSSNENNPVCEEIVTLASVEGAQNDLNFPGGENNSYDIPYISSNAVELCRKNSQSDSVEMIS